MQSPSETDLSIAQAHLLWLKLNTWKVQTNASA